MTYTPITTGLVEGQNRSLGGRRVVFYPAGQSGGFWSLNQPHRCFQVDHFSCLPCFSHSSETRVEQVRFSAHCADTSAFAFTLICHGPRLIPSSPIVWSPHRLSLLTIHETIVVDTFSAFACSRIYSFISVGVWGSGFGSTAKTRGQRNKIKATDAPLIKMIDFKMHCNLFIRSAASFASPPQSYDILSFNLFFDLEWLALATP